MARPREFDETQTLHRVLDVFWRKGYRQTSLEDLEDATGLHRGSLYNAFGDKRALYRKALDRYREWLTTDGPMAQLVGDQKGAETLRAFIGTFVRSLGDPGSPRGCFFAFASAENRGMDDEIRREVARGIDRIRGLLADAVREAQEEGEIRPDIEPEWAALTFISVSYGFQVLAAAGVESEELERGVAALFGLIEA